MTPSQTPARPIRRKFPVHITKTARGFKALKRRQLREVEQAFARFRIGCAFTPAYNHVSNVDTALIAMRHEMAVSRWGR